MLSLYQQNNKINYSDPFDWGNSPSMLEQLEQEILDVAVIEQGLGMVLELMHRKHERMHRASQRTGKAGVSDSVKRDRRHALTSVIGSSD